MKYCEEPAVNLKCVVFSVILALFYWYAPQKNKWILLLTLYVPYILMAYYDHYFECKKYPLRPTYLSLFYHFLKPGNSQQIKDYQDWCPKIKRKVLLVDIFVLIITGYIFIYKLK